MRPNFLEFFKKKNKTNKMPKELRNKVIKKYIRKYIRKALIKLSTKQDDEDTESHIIRTGIRTPEIRSPSYEPTSPSYEPVSHSYEPYYKHKCGSCSLKTNNLLSCSEEEEKVCYACISGHMKHCLECRSNYAPEGSEFSD